MRWVRCNGRFGASLALAALVLQLALSFGHVHLDTTSRSPTIGIAGAPSAPSLPDHQGTGDDYCAVCAAIQLASNAFVSQVPQLAVPVVTQAIDHVDHVAVILIAPRRVLFQPRAPPLA